MIRMSKLGRFGALLAVVALLAACQSDEERAEAHFERAQALIAEGDFDRARVEFLNVFQNNGLHREARTTFAAMQRDRGELNESYSQYLRLVEQFPDDLEGRTALAEMALLFQNWEEAKRHGERVLELAPEAPRSEVIALFLSYLEAVEAEDEPARRTVADRANAELGAGDNMLLQRLLIDAALRDDESETALALVDASLGADPSSALLHQIRLSVLVDLNRQEAVEEQLRTMLALFPEDEELPQILLRYYLARGEVDAAATFLREIAEGSDEAIQRREALTALVQLRLETDGSDAAMEELDRIIAEAAPDDSIASFQAFRAALRFDAGEQDAAIAEIEASLNAQGAEDGAGLAVSDANQLRITLARMLLSTGNAVGAQTQVAQVLESDTRNAEALKMQAAWLIDDDETDQAISLLRTALDASPSDAQAMTLMAQAHDRAGNRDLSREFLSLAVEASGNAPAETLRYTQVLVEASQFRIAEELLIDALRLAPGNLELMGSLANLYIRSEDWARAEQVEATLREDGGEAAERLAAALQAQRLAAQGRSEDVMRFLEDLAETGGTEDVRAQVALVRARVANGNEEGALELAQELVTAEPEVLPYQMTLAMVQTANDDFTAAEATLRSVVATEPQLQSAWLALIQLLTGQGQVAEAEAVLAEALEALPEALDLLWAQASNREQANDIEGAIEIYELMYEREPGAPVIANNLASLLATYYDDEETLDRAWSIARRLRGVDFPAFQDTYGWIAYRRGDLQDALDHLEPAAAGLPQDPLVQFHLGMTYVALERFEDALETLRQAVELAGPDDARAQFQTARDQINTLEAQLDAEASE